MKLFSLLPKLLIHLACNSPPPDPAPTQIYHRLLPFVKCIDFTPIGVKSIHYTFGLPGSRPAKGRMRPSGIVGIVLRLSCTRQPDPIE